MAHGAFDGPIQSQVAAKLHGQTPAAPQNAAQIPQSPVETFKMAERIDAYHHVERRGGKRQAFGIPKNPVNATAGASDVGVAARPPQHAQGNIQADGPGGRAMMLNEPAQRAARAAANVQQRLPPIQNPVKLRKIVITAAAEAACAAIIVSGYPTASVRVSVAGRVQRSEAHPFSTAAQHHRRYSQQYERQDRQHGDTAHVRRDV